MANRSRNKVYTGVLNTTFGAAGQVVSNFEIRNTRRDMKIKTIGVDLRVYNNTLNQAIPFERMIGQWFSVYVGFTGNQTLFAKTFNQTGGTALTNTGREFQLSRPGQYLFDSFFVSEVLPIVITLNNRIMNVVEMRCSLMIEIEEKIRF